MRLDGDLTIAAAAEQAARLRAALGGADNCASAPDGLAAASAGVGVFVLELDGVADCDSAGMQLLLALRASLARDGRTLRLAGAGAAVQAALDTFGLRALFGLDGEPAGATRTGALP